MYGIYVVPWWGAWLRVLPGFGGVVAAPSPPPRQEEVHSGEDVGLWGLAGQAPEGRKGRAAGAGRLR